MGYHHLHHPLKLTKDRVCYILSANQTPSIVSSGISPVTYIYIQIYIYICAFSLFGFLSPSWSNDFQIIGPLFPLWAPLSLSFHDFQIKIGCLSKVWIEIPASRFQQICCCFSLCISINLSDFADKKNILICWILIWEEYMCAFRLCMD